MRSEQCVLCRYFHVNDTCDAFPRGIPAEILHGGYDHTMPYPGDHNVRYEPALVEQGPQAG